LGAKRLNRCALLFLASLALAACGVRFGDEFEGTELFKTAWLTQDIDGKAEPCAREGATWVCRANTRLSVNVGVTNGYPVPVRVACYYEDPEALTEDDEDLAFVERATMVGEVVLPAREGARPDDFAPDEEDDPAQRETLTFDFDGPEPGSYVVVCLTPAAADNGVAVALKISE
jgi:hypothetical protein